MNCKQCGSDTKVTDSRVNAKGNVIRRRRECLKCAERLTTYEVDCLEFAEAIEGNRAAIKAHEDALRALMAQLPPLPETNPFNLRPTEET